MSSEGGESFRAAVLGDLAPAGVLEGELAHRVALLPWRLRRATTLEVAAAVSPPDSETPPAPRVGPHDPSQLRDRETTLFVRERQQAECRCSAGRPRAGTRSGSPRATRCSCSSRRPMPRTTRRRGCARATKSS